jgi:hypothetical protein
MHRAQIVATRTTRDADGRGWPVILNEQGKTQRRLSLKRLVALGATGCSYIDLSRHVAAAERDCAAQPSAPDEAIPG